MGNLPFQGPLSSSGPSFPAAAWSPRGNEKQRPGEALQKRLESVMTALRTEDTQGPRLLTVGTVSKNITGKMSLQKWNKYNKERIW